MDPASIIGLAGAVAGLADVIARTVVTLSDLRNAYNQSDFRLSALICQLATLKASLSHIAEMVNKSDGNTPSLSLQFCEDLRVSMYGCEAMVSALDTCLAKFHQNETNGLSILGKIEVVLDDSTIDEYLSMLNNQTNALQLLLTTLQCQTSLAIDKKLHESNSRRIINQVRDDTSSLVSLYDTLSLASTKSTGAQAVSPTAPVSFSFDSEIVTSRVYQTAMRYQLRVSGNDDRADESDVASSRLGINRRFSFSVHSEKAFDLEDSPVVKPDEGDTNINSTSKIASYPRSTRRGTTKVLQSTASLPRTDKSNASKRILLVGSSESGKSTLIKSLACAFDPFDEQTRQTYIENIIEICVETMRLLVIETDIDRVGGDFGLQNECRLLMEDGNDRRDKLKMREDVAGAISSIWQNPEMQMRFEHRRQHQEMYYLPTSSEYFLDSVSRLADRNYLPTDSDILRSYCKTSGVCPFEFASAGRSYTFYDVGGARSQRRKWIELFPKADVFMWTFDICCTGEVSQDHGGDSMEEQLELWEFVVNHHRIDFDATFVVIFTKIDKLTPTVISRLLSMDFFRGYEKDRTDVDMVLDHAAKRLATAMKGTRINVSFGRASIATSTTKMAMEAMRTLEQLD
ncbi:unnamed protein product [Clonostachys byssicola]|uniref:G-protein alpha subunit-domain-containing protein n=1 Tax=Clonostachys byssicola TaxID=160290 RepID=A0A9N9UNF3_9HYPO|nr:unnamed protein product [Clonostachys byssicola]